MELDKIPGYERALKRAGRLEDSWREFPFLGVTDRINGVEVNLLTLRMFAQLCNARSPFFVGGHVRPEHIVQFLWRLSPKYETRHNESGKQERRKKNKIRSEFVRSLIGLPYIKTRRAIDRFIDRMLIDKPPVTDGPSSQADVSFVASFIHALAAAYGWSQDTILDLPMPAIFQYFREIRRDKYAAAGKSCPHFNPLRSRLTKRILDRALQGEGRSKKDELRKSGTPLRQRTLQRRKQKRRRAPKTTS